MRVSTVAAFALLACACAALAQLSPTEKMLVGTWEYTGIDATGRLILRADHTCATAFRIDHPGNWELLTKGQWRLEGSELVTVEKPTFGPSVPGDPPRKAKTTRLKIYKITRDKLRGVDGSAMKRVE